jgi:hypothetical protein
VNQLSEELLAEWTTYLTGVGVVGRSMITSLSRCVESRLALDRVGRRDLEPLPLVG